MSTRHVMVAGIFAATTAGAAMMLPPAAHAQNPIVGQCVNPQTGRLIATAFCTCRLYFDTSRHRYAFRSGAALCADRNNQIGSIASLGLIGDPIPSASPLGGGAVGGGGGGPLGSGPASGGPGGGSGGADNGNDDGSDDFAALGNNPGNDKPVGLAGERPHDNDMGPFPPGTRGASDRD